jgi:hypothetical protein
MIWKLEDLIAFCLHGGVQAGLPDGRWVPSRPVWSFSRLPAAWAVLRGRADAVIWPGQ